MDNENQRKVRIRWVCDQIRGNPNFTIAMPDLMPLVEEIDTLFAQRSTADVEKARILEAMLAQKEALETAEAQVTQDAAALTTAFDAYKTAQVGLKAAQDAQDATRISEAETALQVAQAAYEFAGAEYDTTEKAYMELLRASIGSNVSAEVTPDISTGNSQDLAGSEPTATVTAGSTEDPAV